VVTVLRKRLRHARRLPLFASSTLSTLTPQKEDAVADAKRSIDRILLRFENWRT